MRYNQEVKKLISQNQKVYKSSFHKETDNIVNQQQSEQQNKINQMLKQIEKSVRSRQFTFNQTGSLSTKKDNSINNQS